MSESTHTQATAKFGAEAGATGEQWFPCKFLEWAVHLLVKLSSVGLGLVQGRLRAGLGYGWA